MKYLLFIIVLFKLNYLCCTIIWTIIQRPSFMTWFNDHDSQPWFMTVTHDHDFMTLITNPDHAQKPFYLLINNVILSVGVRWRTLEVHWRYEAWVTGGIEVLITWVTSMRYEGGVHKRPRQLAEVHTWKPGTKSMVQRPHMRCEHTCDPADPTFWNYETVKCDVRSHYDALTWALSPPTVYITFPHD